MESIESEGRIDMEYTKEQRELIEAAHMAGQADAGVDPSASNAQSYIAELEKPKPVFKVGEVVVAVSNSIPVHWSHGFLDEYRYLNLAENPSTALAIERFERLADREWLIKTSHELYHNHARIDYTQQALADIKKMVG